MSFFAPPIYYTMTLTQSKLDAILNKTVAHSTIHGAVFHVASYDNSTQLTSAAGNIGIRDSYFIASINKLMISALILRLCHENKVSLKDKICLYLPELDLKGVLRYKGVDYSQELTIEHLISHTSGLPCYLIDKRQDGRKNMDLILNGDNQSWPLAKVLSVTKEMRPKFAPATAGKANYSETNFRLLGRILENVEGKTLHQILSGLFIELGMKYTEVLPTIAGKCAPVFFKHQEIQIDRYWSSTNHDIASTAGDIMIFLQAFFKGQFFPKTKLKELERWNNIFFPFKYGIGIQQFYLPRILSPFKAVPKIVGHCGSSGSVAFYIPDKNAFVTGTINQTASVRLSFQALMRIVNEL